MHLMALVQRDRSDAFATLYDRHVEAIYRHASRYVRDPAVADDVTQETFISCLAFPASVLQRPRRRALLAAHDRPQPRDRRAAPALASRRRARGRLRRARRPKHRRRGHPPRTDRRDHARAEPSCRTSQRAIIELAYDGGLSQTEIAAQLQLPLGTVKSRTRLGLDKLRFGLAPEQVAA